MASLQELWANSFEKSLFVLILEALEIKRIFFSLQ
jgi:hypothetical protein